MTLLEEVDSLELLGGEVDYFLLFLHHLFLKGVVFNLHLFQLLVPVGDFVLVSRKSVLLRLEGTFLLLRLFFHLPHLFLKLSLLIGELLL